MGSLRNPIGPLPSSIYWRRRAVALAVLALMVLVLIWVFVSGNGGGGTHDDGKSGGGPAGTITPGPTDSGPAISERPGGRDDEDGGSEGPGGSGGSSGSESTDGSDDKEADEQSSAGGTGWGAGNSSGAGAGSGTSGGTDSAGAGGGGKAGIPAAPGLADCKKSDVKLALRSLKKKYGPGEKPKFELKADNDRGNACKIDLGRTATVVTINNPDDAKFWASDDCPPTKKALFRQVPANGVSTHTLTWFRKASAANCGTPTFEEPDAGTYEVEVEVEGFKKVRTTFELET